MVLGTTGLSPRVFGHASGNENTMMSPGWGERKSKMGLLTRILSPLQPGQPCRVFSIDPDGM